MIDKVILSRHKVNYKTYNGVSYPLIFIITLVIFFLFKPPFFLELFSGNSFLLLLAMIALSAITNLIFYRALESDYLGEIQTIGMMKNIPIIIFSGLLFADERNPIIFISALVAAISVAWSHYENQHFRIAKKTLPYLLSTLILTPMALILLKELLIVWHPISLSLVRNGVIALIFGPLFFKDSVKVSTGAFGLLVTTNILTTIAGVIYLFSYQGLGLVYTTLLISLEPLLVRLATVFVLKEPLHHKSTIAFFVVLASVIVASIV